MNKYMHEESNTVSIKQPLAISSIQSPLDLNMNLDAFQRLRVSLPSSQYEFNSNYNAGDLIWDTKVGGTGTATHVPAISSVRLSTGVVAPTANQYKMIGYGDADNGIFFGLDATGVFVLLRSSVSGVVSDARKVYQADWNMCKFDGIGNSPTTLDITKTQIFVMDLQYLGVGRVRCGLEHNGKLYFIHEFYNTNILTTVYMTSANLPIRYEINDGADFVVRQTFQYFRYRSGKSLQFLCTFNMYGTASNTLDQICCTVITETSEDKESYYQHSVSRGIVPKGITTTRGALISIRPKATFNGLVNHGSIFQESISILVSGTGTILWQIVYNPTLGGSPSWVDGGSNALFEYDISGTTVANGEIVSSGYVASSATSKSDIITEIGAKYPITLDMDGLNPKILCICATSVTGTVDTLASIIVRSYY